MSDASVSEGQPFLKVPKLLRHTLSGLVMRIIKGTVETANSLPEDRTLLKK